MSSSADDNGWYEDDNRYGRDGFDVVNYIGDTTISENTSAAGNHGDGICVADYGYGLGKNIRVADSRADNNGDNGVVVGLRCRIGEVGLLGDVEVLSAAPDVIDIEGDVTISNTTAFSNAVNGFLLTSMASLSVTNVSAVQNGADGVLFTPFFDSTVAAAQEMDSTVALPPIQLLDSLIISNSVDGVSFGADYCRIYPSDLDAYARPIPPTRDASKSHL